MNRYTSIAAALIFSYIYMSAPNQAVAEHIEWSTECESMWSNNKLMAGTQGRIIDMDLEAIKLFAEAASRLPLALMPPPEYHDAFGKATTAYLLLHETQPVAYWVGLWDYKSCEGAAITLPKHIYNLIIASIGEPA